jgi:hypothetical protein
MLPDDEVKTLEASDMSAGSRWYGPDVLVCQCSIAGAPHFPSLLVEWECRAGPTTPGWGMRRTKEQKGPLVEYEYGRKLFQVRLSCDQGVGCSCNANLLMFSSPSSCSFDQLCSPTVVRSKDNIMIGPDGDLAVLGEVLSTR